MKGKMIKISVCIITVITIICCSVIGASANSVVFPMTDGQILTVPRQLTNSFIRFWAYDETLDKNTRYWNFVHSDTLTYASDTFLTRQICFMFPLINENGVQYFIPKGSTFNLHMNSWFIRMLSYYIGAWGDYSPTEEDLESVYCTVNGMVVGTSPVSYDSNGINGKSFTNGNGQYIGLNFDGYKVAEDNPNIAFYNLKTREDISALYITCHWYVPMTIGEILAIDDGGRWQNKGSITPQTQIVDLKLNSFKPNDEDVLNGAIDVENDLLTYANNYWNANNPFDNFESIFSVFTGFQFWLFAFNSLTNFQVIRNLLTISLTIGCFGLLFGISGHFISRVHVRNNKGGS